MPSRAQHTRLCNLRDVFYVPREGYTSVTPLDVPLFWVGKVKGGATGSNALVINTAFYR